jgi:glycine cleavage system H protein
LPRPLTPGDLPVIEKKMGEIESVKAVSDIFAPVSGQVLEINQAVVDEPGLVRAAVPGSLDPPVAEG